MSRITNEKGSAAHDSEELSLEAGRPGPRASKPKPLSRRNGKKKEAERLSSSFSS